MESRQVEVEKIRKKVRMGNVVYEVTVEGDYYLEIEKTIYPLPGYGNNHGSGICVQVNYSKRWARIESYGWSNGWAVRGSLTDSWVDLISYMKKSQARELIKEARCLLETAEDGTPDVKNVYDELHNKLEPYLYDP